MAFLGMWTIKGFPSSLKSSKLIVEKSDSCEISKVFDMWLVYATPACEDIQTSVAKLEVRCR